MRFSLLVATTDRLEHVERLFTSLVEQTYKEFDVIFVHAEHCMAAADALCERFSACLRIKKIIGPCRGVSRARNLGLAHLTGDYVAFPDDDCLYPPATLATVAAIFAGSPQVGGLLGISQGKESAHSPILPQTGLHKENRYSLCGHSETYLQFYRKSCVDAVGDFDEKLGPGTDLPYGCGEDTDYVLRVLQAGFTVNRAPAVTILHPSVTFTNPALLQKTTSYACGRMYLLRKHRFPLWFRCANVLYPLARIPFELYSLGWKCLPYRLHMFYARARNF